MEHVVIFICNLYKCSSKQCDVTNFFYHCTVYLDNVKIPFYQQMPLLLNHIKC